MTFYLKQNDTSPAMLATLQDANGTAVNLTAATVRLHMRAIGATQTKVNASATLVDPNNGIVRYNWSASDTNTVGQFQAEFQVTYADGKIETFPNDSYIPVEITDDIA